MSSPSATRAVAAEQATFLSLPAATQANSIAIGSDEDVWFSGVRVRGAFEADPVVGRIGPGGTVSEFVLPRGRSIGQIVIGSDGYLWFTESVINEAGYVIAKIGRITPTGELNEYRLSNAVGIASSIAVGPDGNLWFTERSWRSGRPHSLIGRITASGQVTRFLLPAGNVPKAIVAGPDGNLWFTEKGLPRKRSGRRGGVSKIGRITPTGRITHFPLPDRSRVPRSIAAGPDGNLWFTEAPAPYPQRGRGNKVGRITASGEITEFPVPGKGGTGAIAAGSAGNVWFTTALSEGGRVAIGSITPGGEAGQPTCLGGDCELIPKSLAVGANGDLWFAAGREPTGKVAYSEEAGLIGRLTPSP